MLYLCADYAYGFAPLAPQRAIPRWGEQNYQAMQRGLGGFHGASSGADAGSAHRPMRHERLHQDKSPSEGLLAGGPTGALVKPNGRAFIP